VVIVYTCAMHNNLSRIRRNFSGEQYTYLERHGCDLRDQTMALLPVKPDDLELGAAHIEVLSLCAR